jgi:hypothetical protein
LPPRKTGKALYFAIFEIKFRNSPQRFQPAFCFCAEFLPFVDYFFKNNILSNIPLKKKTPI